jgi:hypothetical protein
MFGSGQTQAQTQTVASGVSIQSSCYGVVVPVIYGRARLTGNLIWYGDFQAIAQQSSSGSGGKGGDSNHGSTSYDYKASFIFALGEGALVDVQNVWASKTKKTLANANLSFANGDPAQAPWGYLTTKFPAQALAYAGTAYVYGMAYDLGQSAQMPNLSYEVTGFGSNVIAGVPDADPAGVVADVLTNPRYGVGFPAIRTPPFGFLTFSGYCRAAGLMISPVFDTQSDAGSQLNAIVQSCNSEFVWSGSTLNIVPYGDHDLSANGATYTAPAAPLFSLTDDHFLSGGGQDPVQCSRARPSDQMNAVRLEFLDRAHDYNASIVEAKNQAAIEAYGLRGEQPQQAHHFCDRNAAQLAATLKLQRQSVRNVYSFTLGWRYCLLDPMDIVEITDAGLGLTQQWVRILSLEEDDNGNIKVTAEEYLGGTGHAPIYDFEAGAPYSADYNAPPGSVNAPLIFEPPPVMLAARSVKAPQIMIGISGGPNLGGADVYLSLDNTTYKRMGRITAPARQGVLTNSLAGNADPDTTHTLSVNLSESGGVLHSGTQADADAFRTLCYVDGELIAYETASLTGANQYGLTYLRRGVYGSTVAGHAAGAHFCRLDDSVKSFDLPVTPVDYVGQTLYLKFLAFNIYGGGQQQLADVSPYSYNPNGAGVFVAPPTGVSFTAGTEQQKDGTWISFGVVAWTASSDPFFDQYEVQYRLHTGPGPWISFRCGPDTTSFRISPVPANTAYDVQVRAVRTGGPFYSAWDQALNTVSVGKTTAPPAPTGLTVHGGYRQITVDWVASAENDIAWYEVWESANSTAPGAAGSAASRIALVNATHYVRPGLNLSDTRYYWLRAQDTSGNFSAYLGPGNATTNAVDAADLTGKIIGSQIGNATIAGSNLANNIIDYSKMASGYGIAASVGSLPAAGSPLRYAGSLVLLTTNAKLYRWDSVGGAWTAATDGGDISADTILAGSLVAGIITAPYIAAGTLTAGKFYVGDTTNLITDPLFQDTAATHAASAPVDPTTPYWGLTDPLGNVCAYATDSSVTTILNVPTAAEFNLVNIPSNNTGTFVIAAPPIAINAGKKYRFRIDAVTGTGNKSLYLRLAFYDATNTLLSITLSPALAPASYNPAKEYELVFTAPATAATVVPGFRVVGNDPSSVAGIGRWLIGNPRIERQTTGTLIKDGEIDTGHIVAGGINATAITAGTITGDRMTATFIDSNAYTTVHSAGQPFIEINGKSQAVTGHQNGPWFRVNDGTYDRVIIGQLQDRFGLWIKDAAGSTFFSESSLANGVVVTSHLAADAVTLAYGTTVGSGSAALFSQTMTATGDFVFTGSISITNNGGPPVGKISIKVNGTEVAHQPWSMGPYDIVASFAYKIPVSAGDTVFVSSIITNLGAGGDATYNGGSFFGVVLQR